jgi:hypothetical protein
MLQRLATLALLVLLAAALGCAPRAMRGGDGTENPNMDQPAMSTGLDREDIIYLVDQNLNGLFESKFWNNEVLPSTKQPVMAIWPIQNATTEHLEDQMATLLSSLETTLVNTGEVQVVSKERQAALAKEIGIQQGAIYDPSSAARLGRQIGAKYFVTGKLMAVDERLQKTRRVQYSLFIQIVEVETGVLKFQAESARSKALKG